MQQQNIRQQINRTIHMEIKKSMKMEVSLMEIIAACKIQKNQNNIDSLFLLVKIVIDFKIIVH